MSHRTRFASGPRALQSSALALVLTAALAGCMSTASAPTATPTTGAPSASLVEGSNATVEGRVIAVDTAPWAYDGNATVKLDSAAHGTVELQFPARWNLCRAQAIGDLQTLAVGTRVRATGKVNAPRTMTVCEDPSHGLQRLD
ncbi:hypothetical protein [Cognatilysobacter bugurensis]|uniref:Uncharacterized protein n=1 Tax=Cognatilysobacter bugurensis TaxID=543356 RepID=A0A918SYL9_9GAMM|nr:hypothetical protein [Lysobacter bugurensis]GHA79522.1 hypothetical protein GCM10007067_16300 [Lysobacter bugurensis]